MVLCWAGMRRVGARNVGAEVELVRACDVKSHESLVCLIFHLGEGRGGGLLGLPACLDSRLLALGFEFSTNQVIHTKVTDQYKLSHHLEL